MSQPQILIDPDEAQRNKKKISYKDNTEKSHTCLFIFNLTVPQEHPNE